ncbi:winged helix DNA-binding protein [Chryseobacterium indologenes]|nr:winged helix DNA-binding protein [Chryseobacterium indologenes]
MVENKQSINTVLSFGAKSVNPEILEQLLTGRAAAADFFENKVDAIVKNNNNQFWLIIGQRGMGKTHLMSVLHSRIQHYVKEGKLATAYFAEEEYGVDNFFDFLLRILNSFIKWYEEDQAYLQKELEILQNTAASRQLSYLENIIKTFTAQKQLLILAENFGDILEQMGREEQGRLRAWLYENDNVSIIATSQAISDDFDREDRPFYGFFTLYYLKNLSFEEAYSFLLSLAEIDKEKALIKHLKTKGKPQVRAIFDLVKGNHRLLVTFYHFLKTDTLAKVSENFIKTINDLKPYYETYIRYLPPQQQKILRYIALARRPQKGTEISKNCFIEQKSLSKQLSELSRKKLVDAIPDPADRRNKFYDITEPLLRISIEVGEHKEGITSLFIDFLAYYYNIEELDKRSKRFSELLQHCDEKDQKNILYELEAIDKALDIKQEKLEAIFNELTELIHRDDFKKAEEVYFTNISENKDEVNLVIAIHLHNAHKYEKAISYFRKINVNKKSFIASNSTSINKYYTGFANSLLNLFFTTDDYPLLQKAIELTETMYKKHGIISNEYVIARTAMAKSLSIEGKKSEAKQIFSHIIELEFNSYSNEYKYLILELVYDLWNGEEKKFTSEYLNYIKSLSIKERVEIYAKLAKIPSFNIFFLLSSTIEKDIQTGDLNEILTTWIINILSYSSDLKADELMHLIAFTAQNREQIPELLILEAYTILYQEVIINKNNSALYELPKEQRLFFEQKILKHHHDYSGPEK